MTPPSISRRDLLSTSLHRCTSVSNTFCCTAAQWHCIKKCMWCLQIMLQSTKCSRCTECTQCTVSGTLRRSNLIREQKRGGGTAAKCNKQVVEEEKLADGKRERERGAMRYWRRPKCSCTAFHFAKGCELNLISDLRLRRAVFEKESLGLPPHPTG